MKEELEKMEAIEQVLESLVPKIVRIEERLPALLSQGGKMDKLLAEFELAKKEARQAQLNDLVEELNVKVAAIPKVIPVKHYHHFEHKSRNFLIGVGVSAFILICCVGITISLLISNHQNAKVLDKYEVAKAFYPRIAWRIDSAYLANPKLLKQAEELLLRRKKLQMEIDVERRLKTEYENTKKSVLKQKAESRPKL